MTDSLSRLIPAASDSARVLSEAYSISLLVLVPLLAALAASALIPRCRADLHSAVWKGATMAAGCICVLRLVPHRFVVWLLPEGLSSPLVSLELLAMSGGELLLSGTPGSVGADLAAFLMLCWVAGVSFMTWRVLSGFAFARGTLRAAGATGAKSARTGAWLSGDPVHLYESDATTMPFASGIRRPTIVMPRSARDWSVDERRAAVIHETAHHRRGDVRYAAAAAAIRALLWFHPAVWLMARRAELWSELATDDAVLAAGVRPSTYAGLLARLADGPRPRRTYAMHLTGLEGRGRLRMRLRRIVNAEAGRQAGNASVAHILLVAVVLAGPLGLVRLAPTSQVLSTMAGDSRWDARAYAYTRFAERSDTIGVARQAAEHDPDPAVRRWAARAVARHSPTPALLR
ncbi:MAG: M56 family metallopeptidase [Gemmatimonadota bacterium]